MFKYCGEFKWSRGVDILFLTLSDSLVECIRWLHFMEKDICVLASIYAPD